MNTLLSTENTWCSRCRSRSRESMRSIWKWQYTSFEPSSRGPPIQTIRSHWRRTVKMGCTLENTRSPALRK